MSTDFSLTFFIVQVVAAVVAFVLGRAVGHHWRAWGEVILAIATLLAIGWAMRFSAEDALLHLIPLEALIWLEGTLIVPVFMVMIGVASSLMNEKRGRRIGVMGVCFGLAYLTFNGVWMLSPRVQINPSYASAAEAEVVAQTRDDTCVAAALATALRAPGINVDASEAEMAALADVRVGQGSTMLRALRAARLRLAPRGMDAQLHVCTAEQVVRMASAARPALVTVRSANLGQTHMVAIYGRTSQGDVIVADPAIARQKEAGYAPLGKRFFDFENEYPDGLRRWKSDDFQSIFMGRAIVFIDAHPVETRVISRR